MTARDLAQLIGKTGTALLRASGGGSGLLVEVRVRDAKTAFGRVDVEVEPVAGSGTLWMSVENLTLHGSDS